MRNRRWDCIDIANQIDSLLEGMSAEFYGCEWSKMKPRPAARILEAIELHVKVLRDPRQPSTRIRPGRVA